MRLEAYIDDFLEYLEEIRGYSPMTVRTYETALAQMAQTAEWYEEEGERILDITPFRFRIASLSKKSIATKLTAVRSFVAYLRKQRHIAVTLKSDDSVKVPKTLPKPIEEAHIKEVLAVATLQERLMIEMLYGMGLRISELSGLKLEAIKDGWAEVIGKGNKVRHIPIVPSLQRDIERYIETYRPVRYLFEKRGRALSASQLRYRLGKLFAAHGLKATPHRLRHSFATHLLQHGARIADVSELLGHATMATTQIYTALGAVKKMREYRAAHPLAKNEEDSEE